MKKLFFSRSYPCSLASQLCQDCLVPQRYRRTFTSHADLSAKALHYRQGPNSE